MSRIESLFQGRVRAPILAAPMLRVSGVDLVSAVCNAGAIGAFPVLNARDPATLDSWLYAIAANCADGDSPAAPYCPNLVIRHRDLDEHVKVLTRHRVELVTTSVGSPARVIGPLHEVGCLVWADVATMEHAKKAIAAGADGLILLAAGAGGQTGHLNGFSFVRQVRAIFDGVIVLAGGISDHFAVSSALALGADLVAVGTRFIAATESMASTDYREMLVASNADDIFLTRAFTGLPTNMLMPAILRAGIDPSKLDEDVTVEDADALYGAQAGGFGPRRWSDVYSAGHGVGGISQIQPAAAIVAALTPTNTPSQTSTAQGDQAP